MGRSAPHDRFTARLIHVLMGENTQAYSRIIEGGKEALVDMPYTLALTKLRKGLALLNMEMKDFERAKGCFDETLISSILFT